MTPDAPLNWPHWQSRVIEGQADFALLSRKIVAKLRPDLFPQLPFEDDRFFLDPLLFAAYASANPADALTEAIECIRSGQDDAGAELTVGDDRFPVCGAIHPLLRPLFKLTDGTSGPISDDDLVGADSLKPLHRALRQTAAAYSPFFEALAEVTRGLILFENPSMNSFASESAHGLAFLSVPKHATLPYFVDDLAHQCGHVVFGAMFFDREALFEIPSEQPIGRFTGDRRDGRSLFVVFHAVFTEHTIAQCLTSCLDGGDLDDEEMEETRGRLAFILAKYQVDLGNLAKVGGRAEDGERLFRELAASYHALRARVADRIGDVDLSGQPYSFDLEVYRSINAPPEGRERKTA